jgi:UDP-N-acetylglucosamine:LPS N-acetylglucosamine transferase
MELTAARVPFVYVPLEKHFEQQIHVHHRLRRHRTGRRLDYRDCSPEALAAAIAAEVGGDPAPLAVPGDGARCAAERLASLLG